MFHKTFLVAGLLALALFARVQMLGYSLFDKEAAPQTATSGTRHTGGHYAGSSSHVSHK